jgi:hypothetical protein
VRSLRSTSGSGTERASGMEYASGTERGTSSEAGKRQQYDFYFW